MGRDAGHIALNAGIGQELKKYYTRRKFGIRSIIRILTKK
jgi:6-phosphofructokinase